MNAPADHVAGVLQVLDSSASVRLVLCPRCRRILGLVIEERSAPAKEGTPLRCSCAAAGYEPGRTDR